MPSGATPPWGGHLTTHEQQRCLLFAWRCASAEPSRFFVNVLMHRLERSPIMQAATTENHIAVCNTA